MKDLTKEYRKAKLYLAINTVKNFLDGNGVKLDTKIELLVHLLYVYGFNPTLSCEGHTPPYKGVSTFRNFWPYVQVAINNRIEFDIEKKDDKGRLKIIAELDYNKTLRRLRKLLTEFNLTNHRFNEKHLELELVFCRGVSGPFDPFRMLEAIEKHWNLHVMICDVGVQGITVMPQELLNNSLRSKFLLRTQHQMALFAKFLEWNFVENGVE